MRVCNFKKLQKSQSQSLGPNLRDFHFEATILSILYISTENLLPTCTTILHMAQQLQLEYLMSLFIE